MQFPRLIINIIALLQCIFAKNMVLGMCMIS